ncbi:MAG: YbeD family protein [Pontibacterium sp.]
MTENTPQDPPKIEFPCENYPIKVVGRKSDGFKGLVIEVVQQFAPDLDLATVSVQDSSKGTFQSVRFAITATGEAQLKDIHEALKATGQVNMVI